MYDCYRDYHRKHTGFAMFCFRCSKWLTSKSAWAADCQSHFDNHDVPFRCNPVKFHRATACAGYCPVHLGDASLPADERMGQHPDLGNWLKHISECVPAYIRAQKDRANLPCPHPECPVTCHSEKGLWYHLVDVHSVPEPSTRKKRKVCSENSQDEVPPTEAKRRIVIKPLGQMSPIDLPQDAVRPEFVQPFMLDLSPDLASIAESALSIHSSASSYSTRDESLWDRQDDSYSFGTPLSSTLDNLAETLSTGSFASSCDTDDESYHGANPR